MPSRRIFAVVAGLIGVVGSLFGSGARAGTTLTPVTDRIEVTADHRMSEFMVDVDPTNPQRLLMGGIDWDDPTGGVGCGFWTSENGGRSWTRGEPVPGMDAPEARADPWVAFAPNGDAHMSCLDVPGAITGSVTPDAPGLEKKLLVLHARSADGGKTWSQATNVPGRSPQSGRDKESIMVTRTGRLLMCVMDAVLTTQDLPAAILAPAGDQVFAIYRSDDGGQTWLDPVTVRDAQGNPILGGNCNGIVQGPSGAIHVVGYGAGVGGGLGEFVSTSYDNGDSWTPAQLESFTFPGELTWTAQAATIHPKGMWPSIAVSPADGTVVVATTYWDFARGMWWSKLFRSTDGGATFVPFHAPVPPQQGCAGCHLVSPRVAFDKHGRLAFQSMLFSNDGGLTKEHWLTVSSDNGVSWSEPLLVGRTDGPLEDWTNPLTWAPRSSNAIARELMYNVQYPDHADGLSSAYAARASGGVTHHLRLGGDYWGLIATDEGFLTMWNDHKNGYPEVWARLIQVTE